MRRIVITLMLVCAVAGVLTARQKTTRGSMVIDNRSAKVEELDTVPVVPTANDSLRSLFMPSRVVIKGFSKPLSERQESFFVTNNTSTAIGHLTLTIMYADLNGNMLHERTVTVNCNLKCGETRQVSVPSFDRLKQFYYYLGPKPRRAATPFKVKVHIVDYEVPVAGN
ncbi:MAG: FxLYD domain-containing protein [Muribaculaceae bacterium]